jgi:hypothetical protein
VQEETKLQTPINPYKERTTPVRDDTSIPPETFNKTHNMEGEFGARMDPEIVRTREEREKKIEGAKPTESESAPVPNTTTNESAHVPSTTKWAGIHQDVDTKASQEDSMPGIMTAEDDDTETFRKDKYNSLGEGIMGWLRGLTGCSEHGTPNIKQRALVELGVPMDGLMDVHNDRETVRRVFKAMVQQGDEERATPRAETAVKADWARLKSTKSEGEVYLWYKQTQKQAIAYEIPMMPFRGIALRHGACSLCLPGLGLATYETCGQLFGDILRTCMPDDESEEADSIREIQAHHENGFAFLWDVLKDVVGIMDEHVVPKQPVYSGSLAKHAGAWDVHQMMMTQRGTK